ncbi:hypothetical protein [Flavobacterium sp. '19STA2R22 D10 B1']|uniref:hypothetical protein n=1 Tax=Flavobacterium aerium TaxID=3037261 RepID=UPI00278BB32A|nr:hypothetical protein [Flavobacterium sp. '19STA2R22 D10 B1']
MINTVFNQEVGIKSKLQNDCVVLLYKIFIEERIYNLSVRSYKFLGVRGKYEGKINYSICFDFDYFEHSIEFNLSYDQLEFYITKNDKLLKQCNLEDFWEDNLMIKKFINILKKELENLRIPFMDVALSEEVK